MRDIGGADPQSAFLRAVVVGPARTSPLTVDLDRTLRDAGHDVTLLTGSSTVNAPMDDGPRSETSRTRPQPSGVQWPAAPAPRAVPLLAWSRLDTWARTGRRLRGVDVIVLIHSGARSVPALLALLHGAGGIGHDRSRRPRMVLVAAAPLTRSDGPPVWNVGARLTAALVQRVDVVLVHDDETAAVATELGADRVRVTARPVRRPEQPVGVTPGVMLVPSGGPLSGTDSGRTRVAMGAVAREVRHGLAIGSRLASAGFTAQAWRQAPSPPLDLERAQTKGAQTARAPRGRAAGGRTTTEHAAADWTNGANCHGSEPDTALSTEWAHYVGVLESLASPLTSGVPVTGWRDGSDGGGAVVGGPLAARLTAVTAGSRRLLELVRALRTPRAQVPLGRGDLPDWVMPTDVLVDAADGDEAKVVARGLGLPRVRDGAQAWSALGALAAIIRIVDDGRRSAVVVDESGSRSPLTRWARAVGFAPVSLGLGGQHGDLAAVDLEMETLDVIARVHPGGCDVDDVDEIIGSSSWLLRPGGILVVTLPLGPPDAPGAIAPADVRGVVARAHGFGFALVGDLDGELSALMNAALMSAAAGSAAAGSAAAGTRRLADTAYGLVRLTFRRQ